MTRVGLGYDIHRRQHDRALTLGGVVIDNQDGLLGHSDADVVTHALMDALLGAAALGDIGYHFPPTEESYRGISSLVLLCKVREMLADRGFFVGNVDVMIVAESPRLSPHILAMREQLAQTLHVPLGAVSIKATTNEGVGAVGRSEAISAQAVVLLETMA